MPPTRAMPPRRVLFNCIAISNDLTKGRCSRPPSASGAYGQGRPNVGGFTAMPTYFLLEKLQLMTTLKSPPAAATTGCSCPPATRLQSPGGGHMNGDAYFAGYAGLDYYLYGQR